MATRNQGKKRAAELSPEDPPLDTSSVRGMAGEIERKRADIATSSIVPATSSDIESLAKLIKILTDKVDKVDTKVDAIKESIESKIEDLKVAAAVQTERTTVVETTLIEHTQRFITGKEALHDGIGELTEKIDEVNGKLTAKIVEMERHSCRFNIRIVGLDESVDCTNDLFATVLAQILDPDILFTLPIVDQRYRIGIRDNTNNKARVIIASLRQTGIRDTIIRAARKKRENLHYNEKPVYFYEDFCREVVSLRASYKKVMSSLFEKGFPPTLRYPVILSIMDKNGRRVKLSSPEEAEDYMSDPLRGEG